MHARAPAAVEFGAHARDGIRGASQWNGVREWRAIWLPPSHRHERLRRRVLRRRPRALGPASSFQQVRTLPDKTAASYRCVSERIATIAATAAAATATAAAADAIAGQRGGGTGSSLPATGAGRAVGIGIETGSGVRSPKGEPGGRSLPLSQVVTRR